MQVDPQQLRALAQSMADIGGKVDALDVRTKGDTVTAALPGSPLGAACATATEYIEGAWLRMAMRHRRVANLCRGSADNYEVTENEFRDQLAQMGEDL
ncbi:type VII secretion target [Nocardia jiangsuensis]|uniref:Type VII secretion target n=1 Tax=Nocardia jiangsuensis TaxID=1691563 RepID=A0ABV8E0I7_9NOCA